MSFWSPIELESIESVFDEARSRRDVPACMALSRLRERIWRDNGIFADDPELRQFINDEHRELSEELGLSDGDWVMFDLDCEMKVRGKRLLDDEELALDAYMMSHLMMVATGMEEE